MFKEGKEIVCVDNKEFIRLSDAMQVIAPTTSNAARWFKQHQEASAILTPETFVYSDERFPGKRNRVWITLPEGVRALLEACIKAPRLKVLEGVENRIAPFVECLVHFDNNFRNGCQNGQKECLSVVLKSASIDHKPASGGGELRDIDEANGQNKGGERTKDECQNKGSFIPPFIRDTTDATTVPNKGPFILPFIRDTTDATTAMPSEVGKAVDDEVDIEFDGDIQGVRKPHHDEASLVVDSRKHEIRDTECLVQNGQKDATGASPIPPEGRKIVYQETQEKIYGMTETLSNLVTRYGKDTKVKDIVYQEPQGHLPCAHQYSEEWVEFLQQSLSDLVARYYTKMCWLKRAQTEAPEEIHAAFADLTDTLHDTLIENVVVDILKYKIPLPPLGKGENKGPKATGILDQVEEYLSRGYEISFETDKEEGHESSRILCRLLSETIGVNAVAANWREALTQAMKQIPSPDAVPAPDCLVRLTTIPKAGHESMSTPPTEAVLRSNGQKDSLYVSNANGSVELVNDIGEIK